MAISGNLDEASLPDVLQLLTMGRKTGRLSLSDHSSLGHIYLESGAITHAYLVNRRDRLGDILFKSGSITREQLNEAMRLQNDSPGKKLGEILVQSGAISREVLKRHMQLQVEEAVYYLFTWRSGDFTFERDVKPESQDFEIAIDPEALLLEGARRVDEWSVIEKKIPSFDMVFVVDQERVSASSAPLSTEQELIASLLDGTRDVSALVDETGMAEFEVGKAIFGLISAGFANVSERVADSSIERRPTAFGRAGHLDHTALLTYLSREKEFSDPGRRQDATVHIASCPTCSKRLKEVHTRRSERLLAVTDIDELVPGSDGLKADERRSNSDRRRSGGNANFDPAKDRRMHGAGDRRGSTRSAAATGSRRRERRSGRDRRQDSRRKGDRRRYAGTNRADKYAVERRAGRERRMRDRRIAARRSTDVLYRAVEGTRATAAFRLKAGSPPTHSTVEVSASTAVGSSNRRSGPVRYRSTSRSKGGKNPGKGQSSNDSSSMPKRSDTGSTDGSSKPPRHSVQRLRESPLQGLPLLADPTEWRYQERSDGEEKRDHPRSENHRESARNEQKVPDDATPEKELEATNKKPTAPPVELINQQAESLSAGSKDQDEEAKAPVDSKGDIDSDTKKP